MSPTPAPTADPTTATARRVGPADLFAAAGLVVVAGVLALVLPDGNPIRLVVGGIAVFLAPGYLMLQAAIRPGPAERRPLHLAFALGLSPAIVGVLALLTSIVPGGFKPVTIIIATMVASLAMAGVALARRRQVPATAATAKPTTA